VVNNILAVAAIVLSLGSFAFLFILYRGIHQFLAQIETSMLPTGEPADDPVEPDIAAVLRATQMLMQPLLDSHRDLIAAVLASQSTNPAAGLGLAQRLVGMNAELNRLREDHPPAPPAPKQAKPPTVELTKG